MTAVRKNNNDNTLTSRPFQDLGKMISAPGNRHRGRAEKARHQEKTVSGHSENTVIETEIETDSILFLKAMEGVKPLENENRLPEPKPGMNASASSALQDDETAEAIRELNELIQGKRPLPVEKTPEYMDGPPINSDRRLLKRLRSGGFAIQAYCELHGLTADEALNVCDGFMADSIMSNRRCIAYIHGRGKSSPGKPILKETVKHFLNRGRFRRYILAYCSAPSWDGGPGVTYVLLRKRPVKKKKKRQ